MSSKPLMSTFNSRLTRGFALALLVLAVSAVSVVRAYGQDFTLTALSQLNPVNPGGSSTAAMELQVTGGTLADPVTFTCVVTTSQTADIPVCAVTPTSSNPGANGAQISVTVSTSVSTVAGSYPITVTGTSGALTHSVSFSLGVSTLAEDYTLSVAPTTATPSPVNAGATATTTVTVSPLGNYTGVVTLSCLSVTPVSEPVPVCSFNPQQVNVTGGVSATSSLSIITIGPAPTTRVWDRRIFYGLWLLGPGLGLLGLVSTGSRRKHIFITMLLVGISGGLLLIPACSSTHTVGTVTPKNTFVFTLSAADANGIGPSNVTTNAATVSLAVN